MNDCPKGIPESLWKRLQIEGYDTKAKVRKALINGKISLKPQHLGGGSTLYGVGRKGISELRAWVGLPDAFKEKEIRKAIELLEKNGYRVTKLKTISRTKSRNPS